jgi:prevent-host-death family protein
MPSRTPPSRRILASVVRAQLAEVLEAVGEHRERVLIDRRGKPPVALVSVDDLLQLQLLEARAQDAHASSGSSARRKRG